MSQYLDKDGASRIAENFLSKQAEQDVILANLQFDLKEAEHALVKTIQGPAPLNIRALTRPLDDYRFSGNTIQNGTPTPSDPVDVVGCGVRTENLLDIHDIAPDYNCTINISDDIIVQTNTGNYARSFVRIDNLSLDKAYTFKSIFNNPNGATIQARVYDTNSQVYSRSVETNVQSGELTITFTPPATSIVIKLYSNTTSTIDTNTVAFSNIMVNEGPAALPYEPYGYKLPLTVNSTEHPIYLGNVQTTRKIKKLVLTGEEETTRSDTGGMHRYIVRTPISYANKYIGLCTHYQYQFGTPGTYGYCHILTDGTGLAFFDERDVTADTFKQWLADQYAVGTPVTVWYVLATPTTGIVNEPLHKIGDYADTVSMAQAGVEISTTKGFNTITTGTTVLPSNIEVKGVINNA